MIHYYVGGPLDTQVWELPDAPWSMMVPQLEEQLEWKEIDQYKPITWKEIRYRLVWRDEERAVYVY